MKILQKLNINYEYGIFFTSNLFSLDNPIFRNLFLNDNLDQISIAFVIDNGVYYTHTNLENQIKVYTKDAGIRLAALPLITRGGEYSKNSTKEFDKTLALINDAKLDRHSYLIAIGGGAVLDMVGFAAAVGHRGIRHIRIPTTVLSQNDSGVGVKNGINYFGKKNFLGSFSPPIAVVNDLKFLTTLDDRDWISGTAEAVKVAMIKDELFFEWLEENAIGIRNRSIDLMGKLIADCAKLHCYHISYGNDPFELGSSRPLDFGHWSAHKLEQLTNFELRHGEAVAIGLALDTVYAQLIGLIDEESCNRTLKVLTNLGFDLFHSKLLTQDELSLNPKIIKGLEEFREHLGGDLTITLIDKLGHGVDIHIMDPSIIQKAALTLKKKHRAIKLESIPKYSSQNKGPRAT